MLKLIARELKQTIPVKVGEQARQLLSQKLVDYLSSGKCQNVGEVIDGIVGAVYSANAAGIIHRNITLESFVVEQVLDPDQVLKISLSNFDHAIFNLGMRNFDSDVLNEFDYPTWGPKDPGLPTTDRMRYGGNYDVYCLGLCLATLLYPGKSVDEINFEVPIDMPNEWTYRIITRGALHANPADRFSSYAMRNMCDIPHTKLWRPFEPVEPIWYGKLIPETYVKYIPTLFVDPKLFLYQIVNDEEVATVRPSQEQRHLQKIITWIGEFRWDPSWLYAAFVLAQRSYTDRPSTVDHMLVDGDIEKRIAMLLEKIC